MLDQSIGKQVDLCECVGADVDDDETSHQAGDNLYQRCLYDRDHHLVLINYLVHFVQ